ncbi:MAG: hypothetical protein R2770_20595 [Acidimicrobiales bacterium]
MRTTVCVVLRTDHQVCDAVAVDVARCREIATESHVVGRRPDEPAHALADLLLGLHRAVGVEEQDVHRTAVEARAVVVVGANGDIDHTVAVEVANRLHAGAEVVLRCQWAGEPTNRGRHLLLGHHRRPRCQPDG